MDSLIQGEVLVDPLLRNREAPPVCGGIYTPQQGELVGSLGNNTKLSANRVNTGSQSTPSKYVLRAQAQAVLGRNHRVSTCMKVPSYSVQQGERERGISKNEDGKAFFHGISSCGDVHTCPVCSYKISEARRQEVLTALRSHRESGRIALLATFTFPHSRTDSLANSLTLFRKARSRMVASRKFKELKKSLGMRGYIRRLEVTWGESNGWHPHDHEIWFVDNQDLSGSKLRNLEFYIWTLWSEHCLAVGLPEPSRDRGFDLRFNEQGGDAVGAYLTKWGHELTYGHTKDAKANRYTPFSMLAHLDKVGYDPFFYHLFREYAKAFKGRAQLLWSRGLKNEFGIDDIEDTELSERPEPIHHCHMTKDQHTAISLLGMFSEVLEFAEKNPPRETIAYMDKLIELKERNNHELMYMAIRNDKNFRSYRKHLSSIVTQELSTDEQANLATRGGTKFE